MARSAQGPARRVPRRQQATQAPSRYVFQSSAPPLRITGRGAGQKPTRGSVKPSGTLVAAGVHFKLKISKPREQLVGNRYGNTSTGGLVAIAMREGWLLGPRHSYTREKSINGGLFCPSSRCTRWVCGPSSV